MIKDNFIRSIGYKEFNVDPIEPSEITLSPKLIAEMNNWRDSERKVFETILSMTSCGQYGVLITGPELKNIANISLPAVFIAMGFLIKNNWIIREKHQGVGQPNIYYINCDKFKEFIGEFK